MPCDFIRLPPILFEANQTHKFPAIKLTHTIPFPNPPKHSQPFFGRKLVNRRRGMHVHYKQLNSKGQISQVVTKSKGFVKSAPDFVNDRSFCHHMIQLITASDVQYIVEWFHIILRQVGNALKMGPRGC
ncbi:hypothetical protein DID88_007300 [Monilinia fructigena]|uniref:Uncharacterized protein n=1 Tax=Monilinia fructigena TaxID=38457 RepID=A0A395J8B4_9HELO|nr:hypothetical protein DID88_007300 [Monilinia fructigena]